MRNGRKQFCEAAIHIIPFTKRIQIILLDVYKRQLNACMAFPNCVALIGLSGVIASETKKYVWDKNAENGGLMKWMDDVAPQIDK